MIDETTMFELVKRTAAALGYRPDSMPMRSTIGTGWTMSSRRDFLEIQLHFNLDGSAELAILSLDQDSQEDMGTVKVKEGGDVMALIRAAKKLRAGAAGSGIVEHLRSEMGLNAGRHAGARTAFTDMELEKMAEEFKREVERKTDWRVEKVVKPDFTYGGKTVLTAVVSGWYLGTSEDEHSRRVVPGAEANLEAYREVEAMFERKYRGVEFGVAGGSTGEKMAGRRVRPAKKGCETCGCGLVADSLIAPMSAEDKDAEAGPKEGPPAMAQPLRSRRDYGASSMTAFTAQYKKALREAIDAMNEEPDLEPTSALKQAGSDNGIPYGPEMGRFVSWANRQLGFSASMRTAELVLSDKDKAVIEAFSDGKSAESKKLSTDGKTLDGNWMGGSGLATRSADGTVTPGENRPHVKSDEVVLRALKKAVPSRYYKASYHGMMERVALGTMGRQYDSVNDAAQITEDRGYDPGRTQIWYMKPSFSRDGFMGFKWLQDKGMLPDPHDLGATHVLLGRIREDDLDKIFGMMQGEVWSPMGQANHLIRGSGLHHTSMSTGDVIVVGGRAHMVDMLGFEELPAVKRT